MSAIIIIGLTPPAVAGKTSLDHPDRLFLCGLPNPKPFKLLHYSNYWSVCFNDQRLQI